MRGRNSYFVIASIFYSLIVRRRRRFPHALFQPDSWLDSPPIFLQKSMLFVIGQTARRLGYRTYYEKYKPPAYWIN